MRLIAFILALSVSLPVFAGPRQDYLLHCGGCHLPNGRGSPPEVPTLVNELGAIMSLKDGRSYVVRVPGSSQAPIDNAKLAAVINWILSEFNSDTLPKDFKPLSEEEVADSRGDILMDPVAYRATLWEDYDKNKE